jgi:hypothetical protein
VPVDSGFVLRSDTRVEAKVVPLMPEWSRIVSFRMATCAVGDAVGTRDGAIVGVILGADEGPAVGAMLGVTVGTVLGVVVGVSVGIVDGKIVGAMLGESDGMGDGAVDGTCVGAPLRGLHSADLSLMYARQLLPVGSSLYEH